MATKLSATSIKNLLLAGQTVRVNKCAIRINDNDEVEIWPAKGRGFAASLLHLNKAVNQFIKMADIPLPGEVNQSMGDAVSVPDGVLGGDTTTDEPFKLPEVNEQVKSKGQMSSTDLGKDTTTKNPFENPAINKRPKSDWGLPNTDLGRDSSAEDGPDVPAINERPQIPDVKMSDPAIKSYAKRKRSQYNQVDFQKYLGTEDVSAFDSVEEIEDYFSKANIEHMFGPGQYNAPEAEDSMNAAIDAWEEQNAGAANVDEDEQFYAGKHASRKISDTFNQEKAPNVYKEIRASRPSEKLLDGILDEDAWTARMRFATSDPFNVTVNENPNVPDVKMSDPDLTDDAEGMNRKEELDKRMSMNKKAEDWYDSFILEMDNVRKGLKSGRMSTYDAQEALLNIQADYQFDSEIDDHLESAIYACNYDEKDEAIKDINVALSLLQKSDKAVTNPIQGNKKEFQKKANEFLANLWDQWMSGKKAKVLAQLKKLASTEVTKVFVSSLPEKEQHLLLKQAQDYSQMSLDQIIADLDAKGQYDPNMTLQQLMDAYGQQQVAAKKKGQYEDEGYGDQVSELVESWINGNRKDVVNTVRGDMTLAMEVYDKLESSDKHVFRVLLSKEASKKQAGPKLREKWDDKGAYNRDIEAESAEELHALVNGLAGEEVDWSVFRKDMVNDVQEEANPEGQPEGMVVAKQRRGQEEKEAVDEKAKDYYKGYFGDYGKELAGDKSVTDRKPKGKDKKDVKKEAQMGDSLFERIMNYEYMYTHAMELAHSSQNVKDLASKLKDDFGPARANWKELAQDILDMSQPAKEVEQNKEEWCDYFKNASTKKAQMEDEMMAQPAPQAPAPTGQPSPAGPAQSAPGAPGAPAPKAPVKSPAKAPVGPQQPDPGTGNDGLMALGWTQEDISLMDPEDKQKILQAQVHKPGTKPKKAPQAPGTPPVGQQPAPGGGAPPAPKPAPAGPAPAPGGQPAPAAPMEKPMTPAASRKFAKNLVEKLRVRKAQQMLQQEVPVTDVQTQQPQKLNLTPGQPKPQDPGGQPAQAPAPRPQAPVQQEEQQLGDESMAYQIVQEIQAEQVSASIPEQVPIAKASLLAQRLINELGMTIGEAKKLFGVVSLSKLFK